MKIITAINSLDNLRCCVIIPTYNNCKTLKSVIDDVLVYTKNVIIVNDGSTDRTPQILKKYSKLILIHLPINKGKGNALRIGFKYAEKLKYKFAITIDSDGQHFPQDIPLFINALENEINKNVLIIGARNMNQDSVPKKSSFGNRFSNFWFWVETGIELQDTQSGFRLYPLLAMKDISFNTTKFEFEIEVIVKAAWRGIYIKNIPIQVFYNKNKQVSHFRPLVDFIRISILNTWLVILTFLYIKPRNIFRKFKIKGIKRFLIEDLLGSYDSPIKKSLSVALGIFIGILPFWGFQTVIVIFLAILLKLNKVIAFVFSNISLPPFIPFIIYASYKIGQFALGIDYNYSMEEIINNFEIYKHLKSYIIGSFLFATISSIILGILSYLIFSVFKRNKIIINNG